MPLVSCLALVMARNLSGLRRGGPGRPKGSKNKVPPTFRRLVEALYVQWVAAGRNRAMAGEFIPSILLEEEMRCWLYRFQDWERKQLAKQYRCTRTPALNGEIDAH